MEEWRDIIGYEGIYQASNRGRIKRVEHWKNQTIKQSPEKYTRRPLTEKIMKQNGDPYLRVCLSKNKESKTMSVHRLIAQSFIPNPNNYPEINHIDCDPKNNRVENLEWCDRKHNINHADRTAKAARSCEKKIICKETGIIYESITKAARATGLQKSKISNVCHGKRNTTGGMHWQFVL